MFLFIFMIVLQNKGKKMFIKPISNLSFTSTLDGDTLNAITLTLNNKSDIKKVNYIASNLPGDSDTTIAIYHDSHYTKKITSTGIKSIPGTYISISNPNAPKNKYIEKRISEAYLGMNKNILNMITPKIIAAAEEHMFADISRKKGFDNISDYLNSLRNPIKNTNLRIFCNKIKKLAGFLK